MRFCLLLLCFILSKSIYAQSYASNLADVDLQQLNVAVINQHGQPLNFYEDLIKAKRVAINFVFTQCLTSCPLSVAIFRQVQVKLAKQAISLISISVDPSHDTPESLLKLSQKFHAQAPWDFITGDPVVITQLLKTLGSYTADKNAHSNMVLISQADGRQWTKLYGFPQPKAIITALTATPDQKF